MASCPAWDTVREVNLDGQRRDIPRGRGAEHRGDLVGAGLRDLLEQVASVVARLAAFNVNDRDRRLVRCVLLGCLVNWA